MQRFYFCFQKIEAPFLAAVEATLGDRYTPNVENIYKITIKFILETLVNGYEKAGNKKSWKNNPQIIIENGTDNASGFKMIAVSRNFGERPLSFRNFSKFKQNVNSSSWLFQSEKTLCTCMYANFFRSL